MPFFGAKKHWLGISPTSVRDGQDGQGESMRKPLKIVVYLAFAGLVVFVLIQFVPYGRDHTNPPTTAEPKWDSPATRQLAKEHCFQCHSNETDWTWYSNIAPASWLIYRDVARAREIFNFSEWDRNRAGLDELVPVIQSGRMPPIQYWIFHPQSRLTPAQKQQFIQGLENTIK